MRVVLDTNVLVSAILSPGGPAHRVVQLALRGDLQLFVDRRMVMEYREVLTRGEFEFSPKVVEELLEALLVEAQEVVPEPIPGRFVDETDRAFLEVAVAGQVEAVITSNVRHFRMAEAFKIPVQNPAEFLRGLGRGR